MGVGELGGGAEGEGRRQAAVVIRERTHPAPQENEAADPVADGHRGGQGPAHQQALGQEREQLLQGAISLAGIRPARLDGGKQQPVATRSLSRRAVDGEGVEPVQADAGNLGHELGCVAGDQVAACKVGADLARDAGGQRDHVGRRRALRIRGRGQEGAVLLLQVAALALDGADKVAVGDPADRSRVPSS